MAAKGYRGIYKPETDDDLCHYWSKEQLPFSTLGTLKPYSSAQKVPIYPEQWDSLPF